MATHSQNALLLLLVAILLILPNGGAAASRNPRFLGSYEPIDDPEDAHIQALAKFAVRRHNKNSGDTLLLTRVLGGQQQVVMGMKYRLVIGAETDIGPEELYLAVVYEKVGKKSPDLTAFDVIP
ncbi:unnamed protein product [Spirodela intermedia]|uniref:Cystatin domain-containing protein n=2 Tax=Spirodela intermedia TaxID=51605 RepID=A0A7I8KPS2_SPIIN|nr:unnamed protein product [Spirodela intermedia]CAA6662903.1 unnamed protein product [Spirodela intermedia]CAA7399316.1 unnamed protein product [Spirodela intermedia]CAA7399322.1 unnamed protein product [Spirodela intermedia]